MATTRTALEDCPSARRLAARLLRVMGEDEVRDGLRPTLGRLARAKALFGAEAPRTPQDVLIGATFSDPCPDMVVVRDIEFCSLCEHHLLPFHGRAHVAYLPAGRVVGRSSLLRLVDVLARRLQVQERLTEEVARAVEEHGRLDGIANCVGSLLLKPAHLTSDEEWAQTLALNLTSSFAAVRAAARSMESGGSVVLMSSAAARLGFANHEALSAAKAGVIGLTLSAAATYAPKGIRVNALAPRSRADPAYRAHHRQRDRPRGIDRLARAGEDR